MRKILGILLLFGFGSASHACEFNSLLREASIFHKKRTARIKKNINVYGRFDETAVFPDGEISSKKLIIDSNVIEPITQERFGNLNGHNLILTKYMIDGVFYYRVYSESFQLQPGDLDPVSRQPIIETAELTSSHRHGYKVRNINKNFCREHRIITIEDGNARCIRKCLGSCGCLVFGGMMLTGGLIIPAYLVSRGVI